MDESLPSQRFTLRYDTEEIDRLRQAIETFARPATPAEKALSQFILAMEEIVTNAMTYGKKDRTCAELEVILTLEEGCLKGEVIDDGPPFDPFHDAPLPDLEYSAPERPIGGLGIHLAKRIVDGYGYHRQREHNHTVLVKDISNKQH